MTHVPETEMGAESLYQKPVP